jgi:hypothetical protein
VIHEASAARPPPGLVIAAFTGAAWAALTALVLPLAAYGALPLSLGGSIVPPYVWMRVAAPLVVIAAILMAAFSVGIAARRAWSRPLPLLLGCTVVLYGLGAWRMGAAPGSLAGRAALEGGLLAAASFWYFYRKRSVVAYYRSIEMRRAH